MLFCPEGRVCIDPHQSLCDSFSGGEANRLRAGRENAFSWEKVARSAG